MGAAQRDFDTGMETTPSDLAVHATAYPAHATARTGKPGGRSLAWVEIRLTTAEERPFALV